jgi:hypothetical protein
MLGGLGICGKPFCCEQFLDEFHPVSIKMAKTQGLSLNPVKISGTCGRLMCCLKYEENAYEDLVKKAPKVDAFVETPSGKGSVISVNLLRGNAKVRLEEGNDTTLKTFTFKELDVLGGKARRAEYIAARAEGKLEEAPIFLLDGKSPTSRERYPAANGGLFSTAEDYGRFCQMILNQGQLGGRRYLRAESVKLMTTVQSGEVKTGFTEGNGWGLGWCVVRQPQGVTAMLSPGSNETGNAKIRISDATSAGVTLYDEFGRFFPIYQVDFEGLNLPVEGGVKHRFGVWGMGRPVPGKAGKTYEWFNHASNAPLSAARQDGADDRMLLFDAGGRLDREFNSEGNGWDKSSDINVQIFAHR